MAAPKKDNIGLTKNASFHEGVKLTPKAICAEITQVLDSLKTISPTSDEFKHMQQETNAKAGELRKALAKQVMRFDVPNKQDALKVINAFPGVVEAALTKLSNSEQPTSERTQVRLTSTLPLNLPDREQHKHHDGVHATLVNGKENVSYERFTKFSTGAHTKHHPNAHYQFYGSPNPSTPSLESSSVPVKIIFNYFSFSASFSTSSSASSTHTSPYSSTTNNGFRYGH